MRLLLPLNHERLDNMNESTAVSNASISYFEYEQLVTFQDTNLVGNVYFSKYFEWQGKCREALLLEHYPEITEDLQQGFGMATEFAHMDYRNEAFLNDKVLCRMHVPELSRTRIAFSFSFYRKADLLLLAEGQQAIIWINAQHKPSLMPEKLFNLVNTYFNLQIQ